MEAEESLKKKFKPPVC